VLEDSHSTHFQREKHYRTLNPRGVVDLSKGYHWVRGTWRKAETNRKIFAAVSSVQPL